MTEHNIIYTDIHTSPPLATLPAAPLAQSCFEVISMQCYIMIDLDGTTISGSLVFLWSCCCSCGVLFPFANMMFRHLTLILHIRIYQGIYLANLLVYASYSVQTRGTAELRGNVYNLDGSLTSVSPGLLSFRTRQ